MTKKVITTVEEFDAAPLILGRDIRDCVKCRTPTYWRTRRQPKHGHCQDCQPWAPVAGEVVDALTERALDLFLDVFPGSDVGRPDPPQDVPGWRLLRMWWPVAARWDQQWVWCTSRQARDLTSFNDRKVAR